MLCLTPEYAAAAAPHLVADSLHQHCLPAKRGSAHHLNLAPPASLFIHSRTAWWQRTGR